MRALGLALTALLLAGCSGATDNSAPAPAPSAAPATRPPVDSGKSQRDMDDRLCADLARLGEPYYTNIYKITSSGLPAATTPVQITAWTGVLSSIGADKGEIDGTKNITAGSPRVRDAMLALTREATRVGQHYADVAGRGAVPNDQATAELDKVFPTAIVACGGHSKIPWFTP